MLCCAPVAHPGLHRNPGAMPDTQCPHFESWACRSSARIRIFRVQLGFDGLLTIDTVTSMQAMDFSFMMLEDEVRKWVHWDSNS